MVPQVVNAVLSRHNFILLGLRGQAKTRLIRMLTALLDEWAPYVDGCEIHDNPYEPICRRCRDLIAEQGDETPIAWLHREQRYVEKLATPDVTIADMIGDIDPIKAARRGQDISDELTVHYGLLPRANRGIFAINELPDLAGKIQVGLFNIMQEGDVQIKGYPVRLPLDLMLVFTANPEDYTARGKIITPLKDRIGSEIRTHYPAALEQGIAITGQEAWIERPSPVEVRVPSTSAKWWSNWRSWRAKTSASTSAAESASGCRSRCWRTWCPTPSGARCGPRTTWPCPRILDIYSALPSITGKLELEYEGELKGGDAVARELIRIAVGKIYNQYLRRRQREPDRAVVRSGRLAQAGRDRGCRQRGPPARRNSGTDGEDQGAGPDVERTGCRARLGRGVHPGRAVRAPPDQPERRARLRRGREEARSAEKARASGRICAGSTTEEQVA